MHRSKIHAVVIGLAFWTAAAAFAAPPVRTSALAPEDIVRKLYADYMSGAKELKDSAEEKIRPYASRALQKAIDEEIHCETKSGEVCAIDSDYIIAGQDWGKLTDFHVDRSSTRDGLALRVRFREMGIEPDHQTVTYSFVNEDGAWRIADVSDDGNPTSLKTAIESYFREYDENNKPRRKAR